MNLQANQDTPIWSGAMKHWTEAFQRQFDEISNSRV